jgi:hypothetical protein
MTRWEQAYLEMLEADDPERYARMKADGTLLPTARRLGKRAVEQWDNLMVHLGRQYPAPKEHFAHVQHLKNLDSMATEIVLADTYTPRSDPG